MSSDAGWRLDASPTGLEEVRRLVAATAVDAPPDAVYDAQAVAVELVTNAWLHGRPPAELRLEVRDGHLVVEVSDTGHGVPSLQPLSDVATVGRGLRLVAALSAGWGVHAHPEGKTVWASVPLDQTLPEQSGPDMDAEELLAAWPDDTPREQTFTVRLEKVPLKLLVDSSAHIAEVVREMRVLLAGASPEEPLRGGMSDMAAALEYDWGNGRQVLHDQMAAAEAAGLDEFDVELPLPATAAEPCRQFVAALDNADALSRAGQLLTAEEPPSGVAFRHWWVGSIVESIEAQARGETPPRPARFWDILRGQVDQLTARARAWDRLQLLQKVTAELAAATTVDSVAQVVAENAAVQLGALAARVYVLDEHGVMHSRAWHGRLGDAGDQFESFSIDADLPGAVVARTGRRVVLRHLGEIYRTFPSLDGYYPTDRSLLIQPVVVGTRVVGLLGLTFDSKAVEESEQVAFVQSMADALAQALDRAQAIERAEARAEQLRLAADASLALNASLDFQATVDAVTNVLVPRLADWAVVQVLRDGLLDNASILHPDPDKIAWVRSLEGRWPVDMDAPTGGPAVVRTGRSEVYPVLPQELIEAGAVDDEHLEALRGMGMRSALVAPLAGRSGIVGALTLIYAESGRHYSEDDLPLVEDIARRAAFAIETADTFREQSGRLADVVQVAEAAQRAILTDVPPRIGAVALGATYRSSAAEATVGGDFFEAIPRADGVRLLIGDVRGKGLAAVRTASLVLGAARAALDDLETLAEVAADIDRRLRRHLTDEDFVTACFVEIAANGAYSIVSAGHPAPFVVARGELHEVDVAASPPLGLGAAPTATTGQLLPGDRILLYTDGLTEARTVEGGFVSVEQVVQPLVEMRLNDALPAILEALRNESRALDDDLALLAAEYDPLPRQSDGQAGAGVSRAVTT
jgi:serine phosphatase RsbU (regulator of sigma subunit)